MIDIKFSLSGSTADPDVLHQARAVVTTLHALFGDEVVPPLAYTHAAKVGAVQIGSAGPLPDAPNGPVVAGDTPASDGYPTEPSAADAFAAPAHSPQPTTATGDLDSAGTPWDERIHASTKTTNKDGTWTRRRNTPDDTFNTVMAELKGGAVAIPPAPTAPVPPPPSAPAPTTPAVPAPSPVPAPPVASSTAPAAGNLTFPQTMLRVTKAQGAGKITKDEVEAYIASLGVEGGMPGLNRAGQEMLDTFNDMISAHLGE